MFEELASFTAPEPSIAGGPKKTLFRVKWDEMGDKTQATTLHAGLDGAQVQVVDQLDIAFRPAEIAHGYQHLRAGRPSEKGSALLGYFKAAGSGDAAKVADGGRHITEAESFTVTGLAPGLPLLVVRRASGSASTARVLVDGQQVGTWPSATGASRAFREDRFAISADFVRSDSLRLSFEVIRSAAGADQPKKKRGRGASKGDAKRGYRTYYYWLAQPKRPL
jgi:hypothetical protein